MKTLNDWLNGGRIAYAREAQAVIPLDMPADVLEILSDSLNAATNHRLCYADGFSVSVQCNAYTYCTPRQNHDDVAAYSHFELGFPNRADDLLLPYADDPDCPMYTVYPYVPREVVEALALRHGGIVGYEYLQGRGRK